MYNIGKDITNLVSVCKVGKHIYYSLDFIGRFKSTKKKIRTLNDNLGGAIYVIEGKAESHITDDTIVLIEGEKGRFKGLGKSVSLSKPVHIKESYIKYKWLDDNGFIGPDNTLVLKNRNQFSLYKDCLRFLEDEAEHIKVKEYRDRKVVYRFHKYGIDGEIIKRKDGQGKIKFNIPGGDNKVSFEYYTNGIAYNQKVTNYKTKMLTEDEEYRLNELNKIIVNFGLKEIISK